MSNNAQKHSGFEAPSVGKSHPKGTTVKKNKDGTITLVPPKKKK